MSPEEITMIQTGAAEVVADANGFSSRFYATLFEIAPGVRPMFPGDLTQQRRKLMAELRAIVNLATQHRNGDVSEFVERCRALGRRHVSYGAQDIHYPVVGAALVAALSDTVHGWNADHERAWTKLYRLVSEAMREGANSATNVSGGSVVRR